MRQESALPGPVAYGRFQWTGTDSLEETRLGSCQNELVGRADDDPLELARRARWRLVFSRGPEMPGSTRRASSLSVEMEELTRGVDGMLGGKGRSSIVWVCAREVQALASSRGHWQQASTGPVLGDGAAGSWTGQFMRRPVWNDGVGIAVGMKRWSDGVVMGAVGEVERTGGIVVTGAG